MTRPSFWILAIKWSPCFWTVEYCSVLKSALFVRTVPETLSMTQFKRSAAINLESSLKTIKYRILWMFFNLLIHKFNRHIKSLGHDCKWQGRVRFEHLGVGSNAHFFNDKGSVRGKQPVSLQHWFQSSQGSKEFTVTTIIQGIDEFFQMDRGFDAFKDFGRSNNLKKAIT